jgi:hypothetical protein
VPVNGTLPDGPGYAEIYDPISGTFSIAGTIPASFQNLVSVVLLNNGSLLMLTSSDSAVVDPVTGSFAFGGRRHTNGSRVAVVVPSGNVVTFPILDEPQKFSVETYSPSTNTFTYAPWPFASLMTDSGGDSTATGLSAEQAILLPNGKVFLTLSPLVLNVSGPPPYQTMLYDPSDGSFHATGSFVDPRAGSPLTLLSDGRLLVTAGFSGGAVEQQTEVYDAASGTFATSASEAQPWEPGSGVLLNNGDVLLAGGLLFDSNGHSPGDGITSAEIYHPATALSVPALPSANAQGQGAVWGSATGLLASSSNPVTAGTSLSMYTTNLIASGAIPPQVSVGGRFAEVTYFGSAPEYPGYYQVNFVVPNGVTPGANVPVRLIYLGRSSNSVTIAVQ